jgi:hypothetical protein
MVNFNIYCNCWYCTVLYTLLQIQVAFYSEHSVYHITLAGRSLLGRESSYKIVVKLSGNLSNFCFQSYDDFEARQS